MTSMAFLRGLVKDVVSSFTSIQETPDQVIELKGDPYSSEYEVEAREECLVLYVSKQHGNCHVAILQSQPITYSLFRSSDKLEAEIKFMNYRDILPLLVNTNPNILSKEALQNICNAVNKNLKWNVAHIAASFGFVSSFKHPSIKEHINKVCSETLISPLHLAIKSQQLTTVTTLLDLDARLDILDSEGNSVYHFAAEAGKEYIAALATRSAPDIINLSNLEGDTPLHLACKKDKTQSVLELLKHGANVGANPMEIDQIDSESKKRTMKEILEQNPNQLYASDMINGGTPLHWVKSPQMIDILVEHGCDLNAQNFQGDTPVHVMVSRGRFDCLMSLLMHGCNTETKNNTEETSLHLAVKGAEYSMIHALLVFGANVDAENLYCESPRHIAATKKDLSPEVLFTLHAIGAQRCSMAKDSCNLGCAPDGDFNGKEPDSYPVTLEPIYNPLLFSSIMEQAIGNKPKKRCRVLCLDGGGVRGLLLTQMLCLLEKQVKKPIIECFDWISGTSTGAILALGLASGRTADECRGFYFRLKDKVFLGNRPYSSETLEKFLKTELGEHTLMMDIKGARVMVTGVLADRHPPDLHLFRNYKSASEMLGQDNTSSSRFFTPNKPEEQLVWEAARASGAAPTYFPPSGPFLDGGLISNNPTLDTITEIQELNAAAKFLNLEDEVLNLELVVSMGTGKMPVVNVDRYEYTFSFNPLETARKYREILALAQLVVDQATQADGRVIDRAQAWCSMIKTPYFRLNPQLSTEIGLAEIGNQKLVKMLYEGMVYMHRMKDDLDKLAALLI